MLVDLFDFQQKALDELRLLYKKAQKRYKQDGDKHIIPFTAPTGAGKTIIMSAFIEALYCGDTHQGAQNDAIVLWISDDPELNEQSKMKLYSKADKLFMRQVVTIDEKSFKADKLQQGTIYFVNTQKFGSNSNLVKYSNERNYTGWDFMRNTIEQYGEKLVVIIDEAHRGAKQNEAKEQLSIMQKFILGSESDNMPSMPIVIGMSATIERFNKLSNMASSVGITSMPQVEVTPDEVRESGLLKDKISIHHPKEEEIFAEMTYLAEAAREWKDKCEHWEAYKKHENVDVCPAFVIQVKNKKDDKVSETDLDECLRIIESNTGISLHAGEVVHTFDKKESLSINGLEVKYIEPSMIAENKSVKIIFFKDNLSTGWDCPRAETMMSFKVASSYTNIAQLLGRMVRTPLQKRIDTDDTLNDVHLFLPNFDSETVEKVKKELEGNIPSNVNTNPSPKQILELEGDLPCGISRQIVYEALNNALIDTYPIPKTNSVNYRKALFKLCHLLVRTKIYRNATKDLLSSIVGQISAFIQDMVDNGCYEETMKAVMKMDDNVVSFDALGMDISDDPIDDTFQLTDTDIINWSENVEAQFGRDGVLTAYRQKRIDEYDNIDLRLHFILYANNQKCMEQLDAFCEQKFHLYIDDYRHKIEMKGEDEKREFEKIVKIHVSTQSFAYILPDLVVTNKNSKGQKYKDHLYCDKNGEAVFKLNDWEQKVLEAEREKDGFVCWIRNISNKESSLCIQYLIDHGTKLKPLFPDFIIVRKQNDEFEFSLLEPHFTGYSDSVPKLKGMAHYSENCSIIKRNEMMRVVKTASGEKIEVLNAASSALRSDVYTLNDNDELNNLFAKYNQNSHNK